ncbi:hypothetical protein HOP50_06g44330 [Chloropicon primus]|uniref:Uncharacterized protein n=2 Tax=Chloropicon primus TaxID=1764295 RepID=A0A5B8MNL3_9CHLO|nr:hypothetical protein A3770_06p44090 [Chloropicon primus]UPR01112.1 hypothetical protein HOP50_06g44330 [Chloropicon primus]|mmetsp:Transcript_8345/g.16976  ORF Transcript_8345/g.16976 Transcript_8345/m.16976 type:complete len:324 (-) Transcript_8345:66-1037(-)|eukprot:QDZ21891.1 hypothetical protein A3770_06p44090 [Chloropicon primus]
MKTGMKKFCAVAAVGMLAFSGVASAKEAQEEHLDALAAELANASNIQIDLEPLLEVLKDEIHTFVENRADEDSTHKLVHDLLGSMVENADAEDGNIESYQSFEAFSGLLDVVGVPHGEMAADEEEEEGEGGDKRKMGALRRFAGGFGGGNVMIPPGTFIGGSPFIGLNDNPSLTPFTDTSTGFRALPAELQAKFNAFYAAHCLQAGINDDAGAYNFPGFDLGAIEIEVSNGGCTVDAGSKQLICSPGSISYSKTPASLNGFSKTGTEFQGSYCPAITFPKKVETEFKAQVGGYTRTVWNKQQELGMGAFGSPFYAGGPAPGGK